MHDATEKIDTGEGAQDENHVLLTLVYDSGMDERIEEKLSALCLSGWTKMFGGHGMGGMGRKEDTPVWPGTVNMLLIALPETDAETVIAEIRTLQRSYLRNPGITIWTQAITLR